jgi:hypothetical protein
VQPLSSCRHATEAFVLGLPSRSLLSRSKRTECAHTWPALRRNVNLVVLLFTSEIPKNLRLTVSTINRRKKRVEKHCAKSHHVRWISRAAHPPPPPLGTLCLFLEKALFIAAAAAQNASIKPVFNHGLVNALKRTHNIRGRPRAKQHNTASLEDGNHGCCMPQQRNKKKRVNL